jgi:O-antigen/teichoic acid export membrane protein
VNFGWVLAGNVIYSACQWGIIVALARLGSQEQVGQYTLALAITAPVFLLTGLQLNSVVATDAPHTHPFARYLELRILTTVVALAAVAAIVLIGRYPGATTPTILVIAVLKAFDAISDIFSGLLQQRKRMDRVAIGFVVNGTLSLVLVGGAALITHNVVAVALGSATGSAIAMLSVNIPSGVALWRTIESPLEAFRATVGAKMRSLGNLFVAVIPLGTVMFLISLNTNVPRYLIAGRLGTEGVGIYSALAYTLLASTTIVLAMGQAAAPHLATQFANGEVRSFVGLQLRLAGFGAIIGTITLVFAVAVGEPFLRLVYGAAYASAQHLFEIMAAAAGISFIGSFLGYGMTAARQFAIQVPLFVVTTSVTILGCIVLIPQLGLAGAAWATIASGVVQVVASAVILFAAVRIRRGAARLVDLAAIPPRTER